MRIVIMTDAGETPLTTSDLADEVGRRVGVLSTRGAIRKALDEIEADLKSRTKSLGPTHR